MKKPYRGVKNDENKKILSLLQNKLGRNDPGRVGGGFEGAKSEYG